MQKLRLVTLKKTFSCMAEAVQMISQFILTITQSLANFIWFLKLFMLTLQLNII